LASEKFHARIVLMPQANRLSLPSAAPKQQAEFKALWNDGRCTEYADFFTLGYTGRTTKDLLDTLVSNRVRTLVDIRQNAVSMYRPDLSKNNLRRAVEARGMCYVHFPELGVPRDIRAKAISAGTRDVIWDWYDEAVVSTYIGHNLHRFLNGVEHPAALMCAELCPQECHRHRLFIALEAMGLVGYDL
jgi:uncharacterized protein (DUF488 family)